MVAQIWSTFFFDGQLSKLKLLNYDNEAVLHSTLNLIKKQQKLIYSIWKINSIPRKFE